MVENMRLDEMSFLDSPRIPPHEGAVQIRRGRTDILGDLSSQFQGPRQDL